ncbi:MAG: DoxX family protein [Candidatus Acidiferrales bacterium]
MNTLRGPISLAGRCLLSQIFLISGTLKITGFSVTAGYMTGKGMPMVRVLLVGALVVEILGGLGILVGFKARVASGALFLYLIPVTILFHNFWALQGMERQEAMSHFMMNLAVMGALLLVAALGAGGWSMDERSAKQN